MIPLFTSLPPGLLRFTKEGAYGVGYQQACVLSWIDAGFTIYSVNSDSESFILSQSQLPITLLPSGRSEGRTTIGDIIGKVRNLRSSFAAIVNADCFLLGHSQKQFRSPELLTGSALVLERVNIEPETMRPTTGTGGFDGFIFDTQYLPDEEDGHAWLIGEPFWDYWFPLALKQNGCELKAPSSPLLLHLNHERAWTESSYIFAASQLARWLVSLEGGGRLPVSVQFAAGNPMLQSELKCANEFGASVVQGIKSVSLEVTLATPNTPADFLERLFHGLSSSRELQLRHQLETVTLPFWLQSKRRAVVRFGGRLIAWARNASRYVAHRRDGWEQRGR